ncbi:bifunctional diguanylate cyclase/phosphodiesterase [Rhizobium sp. S163]|uniref:putative bifunctional diguanylate cyclase/phosphodiesterase n=1 Tax=Rhizobium sp. S163 TaxID=3055039 RepID=UPI0025A9F40E|nr:bifunctional diguanylate cyclase/phosphodiesterase [Rhizobium sp. S163]MDM9649122.1 bifunctional diguanylate cyclase/phosphodiesterase [Rhizobium sp. S163]
MTDDLLTRHVAMRASPANGEAVPSRTDLLDRIKTRSAGSHVLMVAFDQGMSWDMLSDDMVDRVESTILARLRRIVDRQAIYRGSRNTFLILLNEPDDASAVSTAEHLVEVVNRPMLLGGQAVHVRSSVGIASIDVDTSGETTIQHARIALMAAGKGSRGGVSTFSSAMLEVVEARRDLEVDLRRAVSLNGFEVVFQPQFNISNGRLVGFEALVRWVHERRGPVSPAVFIPLAEDLGLIQSIGSWVLRQACLVASGWPSGMSVSVNVSPAQLEDGDFEGVVKSALEAAQIKPERLELEVTEGVLLPNDSTVISLIDRLRRVGVRLALDDFGTGYSSLAYLQRFSFDKLKIDQAFVRSAPSKANQAILKAAIGIAQALDMETIAEGVETEQQLALVREAGCSLVQGYLTGRPMAAEDATRIANSSEAEDDL